MQPGILLKILVFHNLFEVFWQMYFKNINFLTKTKRCLLCWLWWQAKPHFPRKQMLWNIQYRHIYWWGPGIYYSCILLVYPIRPWNLLNVKKTSNLIKVISSYNICSGIKSQQAKKPFIIISTKTFLRIPLFHFIESLSNIHPISWVFLIDKPNKSYKNSKKLKEMPYPPQKKKRK